MKKTDLIRELSYIVKDRLTERNIVLDDRNFGYVVNTLMCDMAQGYSESRMYRHLDSMLKMVRA